MFKTVEQVHEAGFDWGIGLLKGFICSNKSRADIATRVAKHPSGTRYGWQLDEESQPCKEKEGFYHYTTSC